MYSQRGNDEGRGVSVFVFEGKRIGRDGCGVGRVETYEKRLKNMLLTQQVHQPLQLSATPNVTTRTPEANNSISNNNN